MAPKRLESHGILRPARAQEEDVRSLDEASRRRRRSAQTCRRTARIAPERAASAAQDERGAEAALRGAYRHALARCPGVLGDACGGIELERNERARLCSRAVSVAIESA